MQIFPSRRSLPASGHTRARSGHGASEVIHLYHRGRFEPQKGCKMTPAEMATVALEVDGGIEAFADEALALVAECERNLPAFCADGIEFEYSDNMRPVVRAGDVRYCRDPHSGFALAVRKIAERVEYGLVTAGAIAWGYVPSPAPALRVA